MKSLSFIRKSFSTATQHDYSIFTNRILQVRPTYYYTNEETFADNKFMTKVDMAKEESSKQARNEFDEF